MSDKSRFSRISSEDLPAMPGNVQVVRHAAVTPRSPAVQNQPFTPQLILMALRRWWLVALPVGIVLASAAAAIVWYQFVPEYQASAQIRIDSERPIIVFDNDGPSGDYDDSYVATQLNLLSSNIVLLGSDAYLKQPGAKSVVQKLLDGDIKGLSRLELSDRKLRESRNLEPVSRQFFLAQWLGERITVDATGKGSSIYSVSFTSPDAQFSRDMVNAIVQTYFDVLKAQRYVQDEGLLELLKRERDVKKPELAKRQAELDQLIASNMRDGAFVELSPEAGDPRIGLRAQFLEAEMEKAVVTAQIETLREAAGKPLEISAEEVEREIDQDPYVLNARNEMRQLAMIASDIDNASASEANPESRRIHSRIDAVLKQLESYRNEVRPQVRGMLETQARQSQGVQLAEAEARLKNNQAVITALRQQQDKIFEDLTAGSSASLEVERNRFELDLERDVLARIENRIIQLETESAAPAQEELLRWADQPVKPLVDMPYKPWLMAVLPALLAPFLLAIAWERILQRVHNTETLEKDLNLEVMGEIARFPGKSAVASSGSSRRLDDALRLFEESIDTLGTSLRLAEDLQHIHVLAVTSASCHEGKTSVAAQLAISISQATKEKTLLIDGDMRSPDIHRVFGIVSEPGLEDVLGGECQLNEAIITDWSENLHILPAGKLGANPHRLLGNGAARRLFAKLAEEYRYVIVDTPPTLAAGETLILCEAADATLLCAMWDVSRADQVRRAYKKLAMAGVQPRGMVLNGVPTSRYLHRYGQYHAYT